MLQYSWLQSSPQNIAGRSLLTQLSRDSDGTLLSCPAATSVKSLIAVMSSSASVYDSVIVYLALSL